MKFLTAILLFPFLLVTPGICFSSDNVNLIFLPDPSSCHQAGIEIDISRNTTLGVLARPNCQSDRSTYGKKNSDVENNFSRVLIPLKYSFNGAFTQGYFVQTLIGLEKSEFKSKLGSTADVMFGNFAAHAGYQWFWENGFNISLMAGVAYLKELSSSENISVGESASVVDFLEKNTKSNLHGGAGIIVGWFF